LIRCVTLLIWCVVGFIYGLYIRLDLVAVCCCPLRLRCVTVAAVAYAFTFTRLFLRCCVAGFTFTALLPLFRCHPRCTPHVVAVDLFAHVTLTLLLRCTLPVAVDLRYVAGVDVVDCVVMPLLRCCCCVVV